MNNESSQNINAPADTNVDTTAPTPDDRNLAMLAHLLGIIVGFLGALIIWLVNKDHPEKTFVIQEAKEALNFQITFAIAFLAALLLKFILIGFLLAPVLVIGNFVFCIIAGVSASKGENYRYPITLRLVQ
jgi:uncharacterized Tic20 family protein